jgi:hypothetical protein
VNVRGETHRALPDPAPRARWQRSASALPEDLGHLAHDLRAPLPPEPDLLRDREHLRELWVPDPGDRLAVLPAGSLGKRQVVGWRQAPHPVVAEEERGLLWVIVAVVQHDVEDHAPVHLLHHAVVARQPMAGDDGRHVVEGGEPIVGVEQAGEGVGVHATGGRPIEPLDREPPAPVPARDQPRRRHREARRARELVVRELQGARVGGVLSRAELHEHRSVSRPGRAVAARHLPPPAFPGTEPDQHLRARSLRRAAQTDHLRQDVGRVAREDALGSRGQPVEIVDRGCLAPVELGFVAERSDPASPHPRQAVERGQRRRRDPAARRQAILEQAPPSVREAVRQHPEQPVERARRRLVQPRTQRQAERGEREPGVDERRVVLEPRPPLAPRQTPDAPLPARAVPQEYEERLIGAELHRRGARRPR